MGLLYLLLLQLLLSLVFSLILSLLSLYVYLCASQTSFAKFVSEIILDNIAKETVNKTNCIQNSNALHSRKKCIYSFTLKGGGQQIPLK